MFSPDMLAFGLLCVINITAVDLWVKGSNELNAEEDEMALNLPLVVLGFFCLLFMKFVSDNPASMSYHLDIHTNAGGGYGASAYYMSEGGKAFVQRIYSAISLITPWTDGEVAKQNFYVLRETNAVAGLIEIAFHDDSTQSKWIHDNINQIAQAIVSGIVIATGITK
jgi:hypothetical protein